MYTFFALILGHFRESVLVAPVDAKGVGGAKGGDASLEDGASYEEMTR